MSNILRIPPRRPPQSSTTMDIDVPQIVTINQATAPSSEIDYEDDYVTDEEEIDQIIDDDPLDVSPPAAVSPRKVNGKGKAKMVHVHPTDPSKAPDAPSTSKQQQSKPEQQIPRLQPRKPGETYIDQQRVEKIMKSYSDILPSSKDAVFLISLATQEFIHRLAIYSSKEAETNKQDVVKQKDLASIVESNSGLNFLQETVPRAIPLSTALAKRAFKENERILIATELVPSTTVAGSGSVASTSHKKRQPPLPKNQLPSKGKTRTSARQANGRLSLPSAATAAGSTVPRPRRAAAQKGRVSWAAHEKDDDDDTIMLDTERPTPIPTPARSPDSTPVGDEPTPNGADWSEPPNRPLSSGRGGIMKGLGPGAYGKIGGLHNGGRSSVGVASSANGQDVVHSRSWSYSQEPSRNTGRTIYSNRTDEEVRKAAVEAEEQLRLSRVRQKIEQELSIQNDLEKLPNDENPTREMANISTDDYPNPKQ